MALREKSLMNDVVEQRGFSGAGHATETDEALQREVQGEIAYIVLRSVREPEPASRSRRRPGGGRRRGRGVSIEIGHGAAACRGFDGLAAGEIRPGDAVRR